MRLLLVLLPLVAAAIAEEHFLDVRALVKDTIEAIKEVPAMIQNQNQTTSSSSSEPQTTTDTTKVAKAKSDVYDSLLKLPGSIMSQLARDAGFVEEKKEEVAEKPEVVEKAEEKRVEKKKDDEDSYSSFKTVDDVKAEERKQLNERPTMASRKLEDNEDIFSISKLISATGNAIREAQAAQAAHQQQPSQDPMITLPPLVPLPPAPLPMPTLQLPTADQAAEIMYRPVTKDGKTVYEQVVVLKDANGSVKLLPNSLISQLPGAAKNDVLEVKKKTSEASEFLAPTFPPAVNLFDQLTDAPSSTTTTTTEEPSTTTEEPVKPKRKTLPRRKIHYLEKKAKDMHSRQQQFGAKTVQMNDPIEIQAQEEQEPVNVIGKEGNLRVHTVNRKRKARKSRVVKARKTKKTEETPEKEQEDTTEPPKKKRKIVRKSQKTVVKKEIRKLPDLYNEQWKTQVAPSVAPPSEDFAEQFDGVDEVQVAPKKRTEPQNDTPMSDPIEQRSSKVHTVTKSQEEEILNKEIHKRVLQRIRLSKLKSAEKTETTTAAQEEEEADEEEIEDVTSTTTNAPVAPAKKNKKRAIVTKHQCLNLRSFARQFLFDTVEEFAKEHCYFIENYYPNLTCARSSVYVAKCKKWLKDE